MKTKYILIIALTAIVTLSFTFIKTGTKNDPKITARVENSAPAGGLAVDDSF
jgi:hypothetical protein